MGSVVNSIGEGTARALGTSTSKSGVLRANLPNIGGNIGESFDQLVKNPGEALTNVFNAATAGMRTSENTLGPGGGIEKNPESPATPALTAQQSFYEEYKKNLPFYQQQMSERLSKQAHQAMTGQQRNIEQKNVSRGLGYGGLNEGMKEQARAQAQEQLASGLMTGNRGLLDIGQQIQSGTIDTGLGLQNQMQKYQDELYKMQKAHYDSNNATNASMMGSIANLGLLAALA